MTGLVDAKRMRTDPPRGQGIRRSASILSVIIGIDAPQGPALAL